MTALENYQYDQLELFQDTSRFPKKPYCSQGKGRNTLIRSFKTALKYPQIQINSPTITYWLIFDIDREMGGLAWEFAGLPTPAWSAINPENGHAHIVYGLEVPVCTSEAARLAPLRYMSAVYSIMAERMGADKCYSGLLTHNPTHKQWRVYFGRREPYSLGELADYIDLPPYGENFKKEAKRAANQDVFAYGRNCTLFDQLRAWAYVAVREHRVGKVTEWNNAVLSQAESLNIFATPLTAAEVKGIAKSVAKWVWRNDKEAYQRFKNKQRERGLKTKSTTQIKANQASIEARRDKITDLKVRAYAMYLDGNYTQQQVADIVGKSKATVNAWIHELAK